jgi:predicted RNA binding protein YcfA (HicA-like mRNA interferase family)
MTRADPYAMVVVPDHKTMKPGTLRGIIRDAGMTVDEFVTLLMD